MTNTNEQLLAIAADAFQLAADLATQNQNDLGTRANAIGSKLRSLVASFDERSTANKQRKEEPARVIAELAEHLGIDIDWDEELSAINEPLVFRGVPLDDFPELTWAGCECSGWAYAESLGAKSPLGHHPRCTAVQDLAKQPCDQDPKCQGADTDGLCVLCMARIVQAKIEQDDADYDSAVAALRDKALTRKPECDDPENLRAVMAAQEGFETPRAQGIERFASSSRPMALLLGAGQ